MVRPELFVRCVIRSLSAATHHQSPLGMPPVVSTQSSSGGGVWGALVRLSRRQTRLLAFGVWMLIWCLLVIRLVWNAPSSHSHHHQRPSGSSPLKPRAGDESSSSSRPHHADDPATSANRRRSPVPAKSAHGPAGEAEPPHVDHRDDDGASGDSAAASSSTSGSSSDDDGPPATAPHHHDSAPLTDAPLLTPIVVFRLCPTSATPSGTSRRTARSSPDRQQGTGTLIGDLLKVAAKLDFDVLQCDVHENDPPSESRKRHQRLLFLPKHIRDMFDWTALAIAPFEANKAVLDFVRMLEATMQYIHFTRLFIVSPEVQLGQSGTELQGNLYQMLTSIPGDFFSRADKTTIVPVVLDGRPNVHGIFSEGRPRTVLHQGMMAAATTGGRITVYPRLSGVSPSDVRVTGPKRSKVHSPSGLMSLLARAELDVKLPSLLRRLLQEKELRENEPWLQPEPDTVTALSRQPPLTALNIVDLALAALELDDVYTVSTAVVRYVGMMTSDEFEAAEEAAEAAHHGNKVNGLEGERFRMLSESREMARDPYVNGLFTIASAGPHVDPGIHEGAKVLQGIFGLLPLVVSESTFWRSAVDRRLHPPFRDRKVALYWDPFCSCTGINIEAVNFLVPLEHYLSVRAVASADCWCQGFPAADEGALKRMTKPKLGTGGVTGFPPFTVWKAAAAAASSGGIIGGSERKKAAAAAADAAGGVTLGGDNDPSPLSSDQKTMSIWVSHKPADFFPRFPYLGSIQLVDRPDYIVGRTMIEEDRVPPSWLNVLNSPSVVDEIWVPAAFLVPALRQSGVHKSKSIFVVPEAIDTYAYDPDTVLPDAQVVASELCTKGCFKFFSNFKWEYRKGWDVLLAAYLREFTPDENVALYLKTYLYGVPDAQARDVNAITERLHRYAEKVLKLDRRALPKVFILPEERPAHEMPGLYKAMDCFVLPTRGEGWGLPLQEAMAMGLPTIGTKWGGNLEFMNATNSLLLDIDGLEPAHEGGGGGGGGEEVVEDPEVRSHRLLKQMAALKKKRLRQSGRVEYPTLEPLAERRQREAATGAANEDSRDATTDRNAEQEVPWLDDPRQVAARGTAGDVPRRKLRRDKSGGTAPPTTTIPLAAVHDDGDDLFGDTTDPASSPALPSEPRQRAAVGQQKGAAAADAVGSSLVGDTEQRGAGQGHRAAPSVRHLRQLMRWVYTNQDSAAEIGRVGREHVARYYSREAVAAVVIQRLHQIVITIAERAAIRPLLDERRGSSS